MNNGTSISMPYILISAKDGESVPGNFIEYSVYSFPIVIDHYVYSLPRGKTDNPRLRLVTYLKPNQMFSIPKFSMVQSQVSTWTLL